MYLLGVKKKKVQICPFNVTAPATSCCTPKGTILNPYFSVCSKCPWLHMFPPSESRHGNTNKTWFWKNTLQVGREGTAVLADIAHTRQNTSDI